MAATTTTTTTTTEQLEALTLKLTAAYDKEIHKEVSLTTLPPFPSYTSLT